ncbi:ParB/RepB/Spo0J family partition protein [Candidatus Solincola sp.]|jgi:ParB family chromosome partitioning protein|nr:ParB/RepB/Spo0J family partition protein [Actinomycetota bacterium]
MAKRGLGKGLGALISSSTAAEQPRYEMIPVDSISPSPLQPRKKFKEESLEELAASLKEHGVVQPVIVRPSGAGYELLVGERRWRAAQLAGLKSIPAVVREAEPSECLQVALVENLHRDDLNGIEEASAYRQLMEEFGLTQEEISQKVGKSRSAVANALRLLQLPVEIQASVVAEEITVGHARALLALQGDPYQEILLKRIIEEGLSVRETEELVRRRLSGAGAEKERTREKPKQLQHYAELISASLQARVKVVQGKRKGKIVIEFKGEKDLKRLLKEIGVQVEEATPD